MSCRYAHLSLEDRRMIATWPDAKMPIPEIPEIPDRLGRAPSTIYRELKRNHWHDTELPELNGDHAVTAHDRF